MRYRIADDDLDMLQAFVEEAGEYLQKVEEEVLRLETVTDLSASMGDIIHQMHTVEEDVLKLETAADLSASLDGIFRRMHTVKGLSSFFGFAEITRLSHQGEHLLDAMRAGRLQLTPRVVALLLDAVDATNEMVNQLSKFSETATPGGPLELELQCSRDVDWIINEMQAYMEENARAVESKAVKEVAAAGTVNESAGKITDDFVEETPEVPAERSDEEILFAIKKQVGTGMLDDFLDEAEEHISIISDYLLIKLDSAADDTEALAELFRRVHTMKGNLGLLLSVLASDAPLRTVLKDLLEVFQNKEELLERIRNMKIPVSSRVTNLCFFAMDVTRNVIAMVKRGEAAAGTEIKQLLAELAAAKDDLAAPEPLPGPGRSDSPAGTCGAPPGIPGTETTGIAVSHSIRVSEEKLERMMNVIGELAVTKNAFTQLARKLIMEYNVPAASRELKDLGQWVSRISAELEDTIMSMRMTEVRVVFQKFPRIIRDISLQKGKRISLVMEGEDTELDKTIIEQIGDPLLHLVRNAADHGIETLEEREAAGKSPEGKVWLRAYNRGKHVIIEIEDDGRGMDPQALKAKAVEKGFITAEQAQEMSEYQAFQLVFLPGFSTASTVSEISGRGVGMDVVRNNVTALRGDVSITSQLSRGTKMVMQLPLTLVVSRGLLVEVTGQYMILPLENVLETLKIPKKRLQVRKGRQMLYHRGDVLGILSLAGVVGLPEPVVAEQAQVVVLMEGNVKVGMTVDRLLNEQDVLVKPLPDYMAAIPGMGGVTIMGDGKVVLVMNASELVRLATGELKRKSMDMSAMN